MNWRTYLQSPGALRPTSPLGDPTYNAAIDAQFYGQLAVASVEGLRDQVMVQRKQLGELTVLVSQLVTMLSASGVIGVEELVARTEKQLAEVAAAHLEVCAQCGKSVPAAQTQITEVGTVCDRCFAGVQP